MSIRPVRTPHTLAATLTAEHKQMMRDIAQYVSGHAVAVEPHWDRLGDVVDIDAAPDECRWAVEYFARMWRLGRPDETADHSYYVASDHGVLVRARLAGDPR